MIAKRRLAGESISALSREHAISRAGVMRIVKPTEAPTEASIFS